MDRIVVTIRVGEIGSHVADLQDALQLLIRRGDLRESEQGPAGEEFEQLVQMLSEERSRLEYGEATRACVRLVQLQLGGVEEPSGIVDETTADLLNRFLAGPPTLQADVELLTVSGQVTDTSGVPASGLVARAYDRDLRRCEPLGREALTGEDGSYLITYSRDEFVRADQKSNADLVVRVYPPGVEQISETMLAESDTLFNAPAVAEVNLQVALAAAHATEVESYVDAIVPRLEGQGWLGGYLSVTELTDDDIQFLALDTGIAREHIGLLVLAAKASIATPSSRSLESAEPRARPYEPDVSDVPVEVLYGWFRLGMPTETTALWQQSTDKLVSTAQVAIDQRIIPATAVSDMDRLRESIERSKLDVALRTPSRAATVGLGDLLDTMATPPSLDEQRAIAAASNDLRPGDPHWWRRSPQSRASKTMRLRLHVRCASMN